MNPKCSTMRSGQRITLCVITLLVMMPLYVHSQEEYTCDWIFNSIPQTGLKTEIFEILGEPDELWEPNEDPVQIGIYHDDTIYDTGRSYSRTYIPIDIYRYQKKGLKYFGIGDSLFLYGIKFDRQSKDTCILQIGDNCLNSNYSIDTFIKDCNVTYDRKEHIFTGIDPIIGEILPDQYVFLIDTPEVEGGIEVVFDPSGKLLYCRFSYKYYSLDPCVIPSETSKQKE